MPSVQPGFEYDVFISYRQNDNRSGWVTEFINALQDELAATLKDPISIYFDSNPHDGLHEAHDVDESLKKKLKCLVFIPVVSRTYCDPKAFAWQKEFLPFVEFAKNDNIGLDVTLRGGNVMKRVLPVRIHELEDQDKALFEKEISGVMRPIDFVYTETGVNRPLEPGDPSEKNLNNTRYRNQVNKLANAITEIIQSIQNKSDDSVNDIQPEKKHKEQSDSKTQGSQKKFIRWISVPAIMILMALLYFVFQYKTIDSTDSPAPIDKSIAVLPFENMSNDPEQDYFSAGISEELINALAKMENLKVAGRTSSFSYKDSDEDLRNVGQSLGVNTILKGSVRKSGNTVRITAYLINVEDGFNLWTDTYDRELSDIFEVQDEITAAIIDELKVHLSPEDIILTKPVNVEAYPYYLKARQLLALRGINNLIEASELFYQALKLDSVYSPTYSGLSKTLSLLNNYSQGDQKFSKTHEESYKYAERALQLDPDNSEAHMSIGIAKFWNDWEWLEAEEHLIKAVEMNPNDAEINNFIGDLYRILADFDKAEKYELRALELDPLHAVNHWDLGETYLQMGETEKSMKYYRDCMEIDPSLIQLVYPLLGNAFKSTDFGFELEAILNTQDNSNTPRAVLLQSETSIAIARDDLERARENLAELEMLGEKGQISYAYLFDFNYILGNEDKAVYWAKKAVETRDGLLTFQSLSALPEFYESERIQEVLTSPKLDALFEIRRKNLGK